VGEQRVIEEERQGDHEETPKIPPPVPPDFHESQEDEKIDGRVEKEPVPLVEKIVKQSVDTSPKGDL
jgi:hypothetical protein